MKKIICIITLGLIYCFSAAGPAFAEVVTAGSSAVIKFDLQYLIKKKSDLRLKKLSGYLKSKKSPLADYSDFFIDKADEYGLPDWRLVPAITGVESSFGKAIPYNSYNAYGWNNGVYNFNNWPESIEVVTKTLKEKYINRGLDTPEKIMHVYAPPSTTWSGKVYFFMSEIEKFSVSEISELEITI